MNRSVKWIQACRFAVLAVVVSAPMLNRALADECMTPQTAVCAPKVCVTPATYKVVCETVYDEKKVVSYKQVWETEVCTRPYTVSKQVPETSMREERYTVRVPVTEVVIQDKSYERVRYVPETCEREEISYCERPVQKVIEQERCYMVSKPVCETHMETRQKTVQETVTSYETKYVDQGAYEEHMVLKPRRGLFGSRLKFQEAKAVTNECTGEVTKQRAGLYWTPSNKGTYEVEKIWVPNPQPVQVPRTYTVPKTVCEQVPVTTTRMVQERVVEKVPVTVTEMVREQVVKKVPYTTMKPVKEIVENKVPVKVCKWQEEERVRQVPCTTWKTVCEQRTEQYEVKKCKTVPVETVCRVPRTVQRYVPIDENGCEIPMVSSDAPTPVAPVTGTATPAESKAEPQATEESLPAPVLNKDEAKTFSAEKRSILEKPEEAAPAAPTSAGVSEAPAAVTIPTTPVLPPETANPAVPAPAAAPEAK